MEQLNFKKEKDALIPAIIQDAVTKKVLMLGYMNEAAYVKTKEAGLVTFYSRSRQRLWTKGETSGNTLRLLDMKLDCDQDSLLLQVQPNGPVCHTGSDTCWNEKNQQTYGFLTDLEEVIASRKQEGKTDSSYVASLFSKGINKIAQKVGEEAVELVIEAKDENDLLFLNEAADLIFHFLILLQTKGMRLEDVVKTLQERHR
ncbi:bifunctional phosphoribosyl-AMP cyclohydrolase/phosphoribosyl-ATP diphosphatase HisIE [Altibacter sp. HG106]|uniref:bifunctional phosphoribosyl-AMP cyclohydrolase/phosphoribosyl-ATP diphosphatase HisIE n=1 Tax=Altibacter sp. HG106 TaxID=3023937 RepID=UPI0023504AD6|nr:bifunctional phosphoribosyl-AMP cyclohydrolase/phosphoribosyl-ATP diphosphatase HisIE [Altibacter sp. HG106]MDC7993587.1 bifunctional phosphoribosyl-AMP cyclohydrolase/phosphoribosyl-ATP diphosphatase HisIE [Altibacter sp. HG106]